MHAYNARLVVCVYLPVCVCVCVRVVEEGRGRVLGRYAQTGLGQQQTGSKRREEAATVQRCLGHVCVGAAG